MVATNEKRLSQLRSLLEVELLRERVAFERGQYLLALPDLPPDVDIVEILSGTRSPAGGALAWLYAHSKTSLERGIAILLRYYGATGGLVRGRFPHCAREFLAREDVRRALDIDPEASFAAVQHAIQRHLSITSVSFNAGFGLLLIDTGWNVAPLADLSAQPFVQTLERGPVRLATAHVINAYKERAGHDIHAALPEIAPSATAFLEDFGPDACVVLDQTPRAGLSGYEVIRLVQLMTAPIRASSSQAGKLWICPRQRDYGPCVPDESSRSKYWARFLARIATDKVVGGLPITPAMIRKTRLDILACSGPAGSQQAATLGQHTTAVSIQHYQRYPWIRQSLLREIRVFQDALEAILAHDIDGIETALGISRDTFEARFQLALESGLGALGAGRQEPGVDSHLELLKFIPSKDGLLKLHAVDIVLSRQAAHLARNHPASWMRVWYPLFLRAKAVILALNSTPNASASRRARVEILHEHA